MTDKPAQVKKQLYTRLMDIYRHNDIYIPGFNPVVRGLLGFKSKKALAKVHSREKGVRLEIDAWLGRHHFFFGYGVFRSGTTFLANLLNRYAFDAIVMHEANVVDYWYYPKAIQSHQSAVEYLRNYRLAEIYFRLKGNKFSSYGEINPFLRRHVAAMIEVFPAAKQFQMIRNPENVIRSLMSRELFSRKDPMAKLIFPSGEDPLAENWNHLSRFEKLCWMWAADNRFIRTHTAHCIKFETIFKDFGYFNDYVLQFLGLEMKPEDWKREIGAVNNATPRYTFPRYADWAVADKLSFERICGSEMSVYGY